MFKKKKFAKKRNFQKKKKKFSKQKKEIFKKKEEIFKKNKTNQIKYRKTKGGNFK